MGHISISVSVIGRVYSIYIVCSCAYLWRGTAVHTMLWDVPAEICWIWTPSSPQTLEGWSTVMIMWPCPHWPLLLTPHENTSPPAAITPHHTTHHITHTPHHNTHHTTLHHITSHHTPFHTTPYHTTPRHITPHHIHTHTTHHPTPCHITSHTHTTSHPMYSTSQKQKTY